MNRDYDIRLKALELATERRDLDEDPVELAKRYHAFLTGGEA